jgi:aldehyde dehydrogenase (NAD+)
VPSEAHPLAATDLYQVLETSDVPAGVVNIVTGARDGLTKVLAEHDDVDALWVFGSKDASAAAEKLSAGNLKRTLVDHGLATDWFDPAAAEGPIFLRHAVQVKNIWIPFGE